MCSSFALDNANSCFRISANVLISCAVLVIVLYSSIYIAPLNSHGSTETLLVRLAPRKETSFKK